MKNQFVTYEIAKALKELGFIDPCLAWYNDYGTLFMVNQVYGDSNINTTNFSENLAPLWQQVIDWFDEKYNLCIFVRRNDEFWLKNVEKEILEKPERGLDIKDFKYDLNIMEDVEYIASGNGNDSQKLREQGILKAIEIIKNR